MEIENPKSAEWACSLETREGKILQFKSDGYLLLNSLLFREVSLLLYSYLQLIG